MNLPNPDKPAVLETNASIHAVGAVVLQSDGEEEYTTIIFIQAILPPNAPTPHMNGNSWHLYCDAFIVYLLGREFTLHTGNAALNGIFNSHLSSAIHVAKCLLAMEPFRFTVNHIGLWKLSSFQLNSNWN